MIIFHEGLPRQGKSYEACVKQIVPTLKRGREVYAYVDGLDHAKFAEVTGLPLPVIQKLLHQLTKEQIPDVQNHVADNSLVVIDELQDFFPVSSKLSPGITTFVTQHGHRGIDILAMGQDHRDCHMLWKRRIDTLITFVKRDAIGRPNEYTWTTHKQKNGKFVELRTGKGEYEPKYFGLYKSHVDGVTEIDSHEDDRTNIFKSSAFRIWLPAFGLVLLYAAYSLYGFFTDSSKIVNVKAKPVTVTETISAPKPVTIETKTAPTPAVKEEPKPKVERSIQFADFLQQHLTEYRPRLAAIIENKRTGALLAKIDFYDNGSRIYDTFGVKQIEALGYKVTKAEFGVLLTKDGKSYPVTAWPLDISPNTPDQKVASLKDEVM
jgi:zona occludens toxin